MRRLVMAIARLLLACTATACVGCADLIGLGKGELDTYRPPCSGVGGRLVSPASVWANTDSSSNRENAGEVVTYGNGSKAVFLRWTQGAALYFAFADGGTTDLLDDWKLSPPLLFQRARIATDGADKIYLAATLQPGAAGTIDKMCSANPSMSLLAQLDAEGGTCIRGRELGEAASTDVRAVAATPEAVAVLLRVFDETPTCAGSGPGLHLLAYDAHTFDCNEHASLILLGDVDATALAYGPDGSLFVAGDYDTSDGKVAIDGDVLPDSKGRDLFVLRVPPKDEPHLFAVHENDTQSIVALAALPNGDVVVAGTYDEKLDFEDDCSELPPAGSAELNTFVARIGNDHVIWSVGFGNDQTAEAPHAIDATGEAIYVAGSFGGEVTFGGSEPAKAGGESSAFLTRLDAFGNFDWTMILNGADTEANSEANVYGVAAGAGGTDDVYLTGSFSGKVDLGKGPVVSKDAESSFVLKVPASGSP